MKAELRADGLHISGYVNVPGRESRPFEIKKYGDKMMIEIIEQRAFARAIKRAPKIDMLLDHNHDRTLASTSDGTLSVAEDAVGLRAESVVTDPEVIAGAKAGKLRGWSFNMNRVQDSLEERAGQLPVRHVKDFDMSEISLIMNRLPIYSSTSIEIRAEGQDEDVEYRAATDVDFVEIETQKAREPEKQEVINKKYKDILAAYRHA